MSGMPSARSTGWFGADRRGYVLATAGIALAVIGMPSPLLVGIGLRTIFWSAPIPLGFTVVAAGFLAASVVGGFLGLTAARSSDGLASRRARAARWTSGLTLAIGAPLALFFGLYGDPG